MARTNNLTNFLTDVANAIKTKKGSEATIQASSFDTEILALPSQGTYQSKNITISQNGVQTVVPDTGYDAISELEITTNVPTVELQTKAITVTSNGSLEILPDTGYDGFTKLNLTTNVQSGDATSDATLQAKYLLQGYSAVVNGQLIQGTMVDRGTLAITPTSNDIVIPEGHYNSLSISIINAANCEDYTECNQAILSI